MPKSSKPWACCPNASMPGARRMRPALTAQSKASYRGAIFDGRFEIRAAPIAGCRPRLGHLFGTARRDNGRHDDCRFDSSVAAPWRRSKAQSRAGAPSCRPGRPISASNSSFAPALIRSCRRRCPSRRARSSSRNWSMPRPNSGKPLIKGVSFRRPSRRSSRGGRAHRRRQINPRPRSRRCPWGRAPASCVSTKRISNIGTGRPSDSMSVICPKTSSCSPARWRTISHALKEDVPSEDIVDAARAAGAHELIARLPDGYENYDPIGRRPALRRPTPARCLGPGHARQNRNSWSWTSPIPISTAMAKKPSSRPYCGLRKRASPR